MRYTCPQSKCRFITEYHQPKNVNSCYNDWHIFCPWSTYPWCPNGTILKYPARFKGRQHCRDVWENCAKQYNYDPDVSTENDEDEEEDEEEEEKEEHREEHEHEHKFEKDEREGEKSQAKKDVCQKEGNINGRGRTLAWKANDKGEFETLEEGDMSTEGQSLGWKENDKGEIEILKE
jgi:hypothetical protein